MPTGLDDPAGSNPSEPPAPTLDMGQMVPVTIEGVPQMLPLQEVVNGYATKAKMTQATQEAASLRDELGKYQRFMNQLESDPTGTIAHLQKTYGVSTPRTPGNEDSPDDDSPESAEVAQLKMALAKQERDLQGLKNQLASQAHRSELDKSFDTAATKYGDAFNREAISAYMVANSIDNVEHAYKLWKFDNDTGAQSSDHSRMDQRIDQRIDQEAESLSQIMPGSPTNSPPPVDPSLKPATDVVEAVRRAYAEQNLDLDQELAALRS